MRRSARFMVLAHGLLTKEDVPEKFRNGYLGGTSMTHSSTQIWVVYEVDAMSLARAFSAGVADTAAPKEGQIL